MKIWYVYEENEKPLQYKSRDDQNLFVNFEFIDCKIMNKKT